MNYYFLKEDLEELDIKISEIRKRIDFYQKEKGLSTTQSSETWHDNYGFEESERQIKRLWGQLQELAEIRGHAEIIDPQRNSNKTDIGKIIKIKDLKTGKEKEILIGSYIVFKNKSAISYNSPLAQILAGAKKGETRDEFQILEVN